MLETGIDTHAEYSQALCHYLRPAERRSLAPQSERVRHHQYHLPVRCQHSAFNNCTNKQYLLEVCPPFPGLESQFALLRAYRVARL